MKKISSFMLAIVMIVSMVFVMNSTPITAHAAEASVWDGTTITKPTSLKKIDGVYYYEISTAEELTYISKAGGDWLGYNYILANDIVLNSVKLTYDSNGNLTVDASTLNQWTPIHNFKGVFNGNEFSISGVYVDEASDAGFFTATVFSAEATIKNLHLKNSYIKGKYTVGGIISLSEGLVSNCSYDGVVVGSGITQDVTGIGGIVGHTFDAPITNCINYGDVFGQSYVGGILGSGSENRVVYCENYGSVSAYDDSVGGIVGSYSWGDISYCTNKGMVSGNTEVGGIIGYGCSNTNNCTNLGDTLGTLYVGGVVGKAIRGSGGNNLQNIGNVLGDKYVGGIVGYQIGETSWYIYFSSMSNTGNITGSEYVGGIVGCVKYGSIYNAYNSASVAADTNVGAIAGYSDTVWGRGVASECYYLKSETINSSLNGFGNSIDDDGVVNAKDHSFFCINADKTLNTSGHTYSSTLPCDATCDTCSYERTVTHTYDNIKYDSDEHWYECDCGKKKTSSESNHTYVSASCTAPKTCKVCGATTGNKISHKYDTGKVTKATLTKNGSIVKKCTVCGKVASKTTIKYAKTFKLSTTSYTYNGKVKTPSITVKDSAGKTLEKNTDYTATYASGRKNVGTYKVTIKGKGNYSFTKTLTFKINPAKTTVSKLTAGKKSITVAITKKSTQVTGYQIQYSTSKSFSKATTKTISSYKTTKYTLKSLSAKKTYYVRVRTYKTANGKKHYSGWSTYKYVKTK